MVWRPNVNSAVKRHLRIEIIVSLKNNYTVPVGMLFQCLFLYFFLQFFGSQNTPIQHGIFVSMLITRIVHFQLSTWSWSNHARVKILRILLWFHNNCLETLEKFQKQVARLFSYPLADCAIHVVCHLIALSRISRYLIIKIRDRNLFIFNLIIANIINIIIIITTINQGRTSGYLSLKSGTEIFLCSNLIIET